jgi:hypothetical protein
LPVTLTRPSVRSTDFPTTEYSSISLHPLLKNTVTVSVSRDRKRIYYFV